MKNGHTVERCLSPEANGIRTTGRRSSDRTADAPQYARFGRKVERLYPVDGLLVPAVLVGNRTLLLMLSAR